MGDEFQGLFISPENIFLVAYLVKSKIFPEKMSFGVGKGTLDYSDNNKETPLGSNGPAWYNARDAQLFVKDGLNTNKSMFVSGVRVLGSSNDKIINELLKYCDILCSEWTERQTEINSIILKMHITQERYSQQQIANQIGISQSALNQHLKRTHIMDLIETLKILGKEI